LGTIWPSTSINRPFDPSTACGLVNVSVSGTRRKVSGR